MANLSDDCMKRIYLHILYTCLAVILFAGCKSDYPDIEYDGDLGKVEFDDFSSPIPIMVAIDDPLYENITRGMGALSNLEDKRAFDSLRVYAFYSPKGVDNVYDHTSYSERMDSKDGENIYCLIDDADNAGIGHGKKARMNYDAPSILEWTDGDNVYYSTSHPQARFRFFAYHVDDAADMGKAPRREADYVAYDIEVDGTQDLMCSYAQPTAGQMANVPNLTSPSNKDFVNNLEKYTYSTVSASRELIPVFTMKHQMAYLRLFLKAERVLEELDPQIDKMRVENVIIKGVHYQGEFVVAAEDPGRLGVTYSDATKDFYLPVKVRTDVAGSPVKDTNGKRITVSSDEEGKVMAGDAVGLNPRLIPTEEEQELGMGFLFPPAKKYSLWLKCKVLTGKINPSTGKEVEVEYNRTFELAFPDGSSFEAGHQYRVSVKVYGPRDIRLQMGNIEWKEGESIEIDSEK